MRISDWSSDVCSSDLFVDRQQRSVLACGGGELAEHVLPAALGPAALGLAGEEIDEEGAAIDPALHRRERQRAAHRSEEHTSELQSLMRISYAVFCWQKKK